MIFGYYTLCHVHIQYHILKDISLFTIIPYTIVLIFSTNVIVMGMSGHGGGYGGDNTAGPDHGGYGGGTGPGQNDDMGMGQCCEDNTVATLCSDCSGCDGCTETCDDGSLLNYIKIIVQWHRRVVEAVQLILHYDNEMWQRPC